MAEKKQGVEENGNEAARHKSENPKTHGMQMPGVDFEDMNFEQRRAPYDSGRRFIKDKEYDQSGHNDSSGY